VEPGSVRDNDFDLLGGIPRSRPPGFPFGVDNERLRRGLFESGLPGRAGAQRDLPPRGSQLYDEMTKLYPDWASNQTWLMFGLG
jgi:hypothetical protein